MSSSPLSICQSTKLMRIGYQARTIFAVSGTPARKPVQADIMKR